jgi:ankyrin repeat protein
MKTNTHINLRKDGDKLFKAAKFQEAIDKYQEAVQLNSNYYVAYVHLAKALMAQCNYDEAINQCHIALTIKKNYVYAYRLKGDAHKLKAGKDFNSNNLDKAEEEYATAKDCYNTAIKFSGNNYKIGENCLANLESLKVLVNNMDKKKPAKSIIDEDRESTIAPTDPDFDNDPEEAIALRKKGDAEIDNKNYEAAIIKYMLSIESYPEYYVAYVHLAKVFLEQNRPDEAIEYCQKALNITNTDYPYAYQIKGDAHKLKTAILLSKKKDPIEISEQYKQAETCYKSMAQEKTKIMQSRLKDLVALKPLIDSISKDNISNKSTADTDNSEDEYRKDPFDKDDLDDGVKEQTTNINLSTDIFQASQAGDIVTLQWLINESNIDINSKNHYKKTALHYAAANGHVKTVKFLLKNGAEVNSTDELGFTPLRLAISNNHQNIIEALLDEKSTDPNISDIFGLTALHVAAENGNNKTLQLLIKHNGNIKITTDTYKDTLIHSAAQGIINGIDTWGVMKWLLEHNVDCLSTNKDNMTVKDILSEHHWSYADQYDELCKELGHTHQLSSEIL